MFFAQLEKLCQKNNTTPSTVARELGYSMGSVSHWRKGNCPGGDIVVRFADYFDVSTDYLLGRTNSPKFTMQSDAIKDPASKDARANMEESYSPDEIELIEDYRSLNTGGKEYIRQTMRITLEAYKKGIAFSDMEIAREIV